MPLDLPEDFLTLLRSVTAKRPKTVIDHILEHGYITNQELTSTYGYEHPPRAIQDVRDLGIPLERFKVKNSQGQMITAYRFGEPSEARQEILKGRKSFSKKFKKDLGDSNGNRCGVCLTILESRYLQIDHRIPYQVAGEGEGSRDPGDYMLLCGSCNRAKSWSCEHCPNWNDLHDPDICKSCYWAYPEFYSHIATQELRRLDLTWNHDEVGQYDRLAVLAQESGASVAEFVKLLVKSLSEKGDGSENGT